MLKKLAIINDLESKVSEAIAPSSDVFRPVSEVYMTLVRLFPLRPIVNSRQNKIALGVSERLMVWLNQHKSEIDPKHGEEIEEYVRCLGDLISDFERTAYPIEHASGAEMLAYLMETRGLKQGDLAEEVGGQSVVSAILAEKRKLNRNQIEALSRRFGVSPNLFFEPENVTSIKRKTQKSRGSK